MTFTQTTYKIRLHTCLSLTLHTCPLLIVHTCLCLIGICLFQGITGCVSVAPSPTPSLPVNCDEPTSLFSATELLTQAEHDCFPWVSDLRGRIARSGRASASIWTRRTDARNPLITSATHALGVGWFGPENTDIPATLRDPTMESGVGRIFLFDESIGSSGGVDTLATPVFNFFNPDIPASENNNSLINILPRNDFFVGVIDRQKLATTPAQTPEPLVAGEVTLSDPVGTTLDIPTFADPSPGDIVLLLGFPGEGSLAGDFAASVGRVLSDEEATIAVANLALVDDEEGGIAYDAEAEMILEADAAGGMSGGGVFDKDRRQIGVIVRVSEAVNLPTYVRAVRMSFVVAELNDAFDALATEAQATIRPFIETSTEQMMSTTPISTIPVSTIPMSAAP